jgi:hypothetical protein
MVDGLAGNGCVSQDIRLALASLDSARAALNGSSKRAWLKKTRYLKTDGDILMEVTMGTFLTSFDTSWWLY